MDDKKALIKKLAKVMQGVKYIQKRGRNAHFGYTYATEADVAEKVREALAEQNVIMLPSVVGHEFRETTTAKGKKEYICTVDMEFAFYDGDSGESLTIKMSGDGQDSGDKAIFKAISGCAKYAQMKAFLIPTGDDPEEDAGEGNGKPAPKGRVTEEEVGEYSTTTTPPRAASNSNGCSSCGATMTEAQITLSEKKYGKALCPKCQKGAKQ